MPGPAAGPSQMPNSEDVDDAMAAAGNLVCHSFWCRLYSLEPLLQHLQPKYKCSQGMPHHCRGNMSSEVFGPQQVCD